MNMEHMVPVAMSYAGREFSLYGFNGCYITQMIANTGRFYEEDLLDTVFHRYGTGGVYVDFGAFIGTHTIFFSAICNADLVIAVEPLPVCAERLACNVVMNNCSNVDVLLVGAGAYAGRATCELNPKNAGGNNLTLGPATENSIPIVKAGELITAPPKLIKIDAERMTPDVLAGCSEIIEQHRPVIVVEDRDHELTKTMNGLGYKETGRFCATPTYIYEPN